MKARLTRLLVALIVLLVSRGRAVPADAAPQSAPEHEPDQHVPPGTPEPRAELIVIALMLLGACLAIGFVVVYALDRLPDQTQLLGACLGLSLLSFAAALILAGKRLVVTEEIQDDYPVWEHPDEQRKIVQIVEESGSRITRRRLLKVCAGLGGGALAAALVTPAASLGPVIDMESMYQAPWRRGRRLVDERGSPFRAADIEHDSMYTAFAEGADKEAMAASVVVVRLPPSTLALPADVAHYAVEGIVAYSKICTHAGCAISLFRAPLFQPDEPRPALVCPCHYSAFDPGAGGTVLGGPAGRKLPMLPLAIDRQGRLRAAGTFNEPVGPSWWGVRLRRPRP